MSANLLLLAVLTESLMGLGTRLLYSSGGAAAINVSSIYLVSASRRARG